MPHEITIDRSGRLVIPKKIRQQHHLDAGTRLTLLDEGERLVLVPQRSGAKLVEKNGLLVVAAPAGQAQDIPDHRSLAPRA